MAEEHTITLKSSDGRDFIISKNAAILSETIKAMVEEDDSSSIFPLSIVDSKTLADVVTFLNMRVDCGDDDDKKKSCDEEFMAGKDDMKDLFNHLLAANYLDIKDLLDIICKKIADMMQGNSPEWVRKAFSIENDFLPEEEEKVREEHAWAYQGPHDD
ncbi:hypothetical protein RD792_013417 [Penstemon davidsonii]|uniref:SKP1-like protein n=1 Tax=Penstemon davidsonii TaxID=160366 RepID=A0ABR0CTF4_9LAMI|nr:hypothetical protein RD792_013417 [Penstemon davidsonii]